MNNFLKKFDIFGHPISVLYKGNTKQNTILGSIFSILTAVSVTIFAVNSLIEGLSHRNQTIRTKTISTDLNQEGPINLQEADFNLMFTLMGYDSDG